MQLCGVFSLLCSELSQNDITGRVCQANQTAGFLTNGQRARMMGGNAIDFFKLNVPTETTNSSGSTVSAAAYHAVGSPPRVHNFINGADVAAIGGGTLELENPATGRVNGLLAASTDADVDSAVQAAAGTLGKGSAWSSMSLEARCRVLSSVRLRQSANCSLLSLYSVCSMLWEV